MAHRETNADFLRGYEIFQSFVRGDELIGLVPAPAVATRTMMNALWAAAITGIRRAYRTIGDCYLARIHSLGGFAGVDPLDACQRPWSGAALAVATAEPSITAVLRSLRECIRLGDRPAIADFARMTRDSTADHQQLARALLLAVPTPTGAELYQLGLVQYWLGTLQASAASHHQAAELGNRDAQFELHLYYAHGLGVTATAETSHHWLVRAAEGGHPHALYNLGALHASGAAGKQDTAQAVEYYERAAEHGSGRAAATLAGMILAGKLDGTGPQALEWLALADDRGFSSRTVLEAMGVVDPRTEA